MCIDNRGHEESLLPGKVYRVVRPVPGDQAYEFRIVDEEGEDYLYPARRFVPIELSGRALKAVAAVAPAA